MDAAEAHKVVTQACAAYRGTLQEHLALQEALRILAPPAPAEEQEKKAS